MVNTGEDGDVDQDTIDRLAMCVRLLMSTQFSSLDVQVDDSGAPPKSLLLNDVAELGAAFTLRQLTSSGAPSETQFRRKTEAEGCASTLDNLVQLTGYSDPVYAEANVSIRGYDVVLGRV